MLFVCFFALMACTSKQDKAAENIVINELMTSNRTGLLSEKGKTADWIELKNTSNDSINLKGFKLAVVKPVASDSVTDNKKNKEKVTEWEFPKVTLGAGQCLLVYAEKEKKKKKKATEDAEEGEIEEELAEEDAADAKSKEYKPGDPLTANLKLPKEGATVQFKTRSGKVINEVKYGPMTPDHSLARQADNSYISTYWQSPGFENNRAGYEAAALKIQEQRKDPLKIWELMSRAKKSGDNWVELKNTGDSVINLSAYSLCKKMSNNEKGWTLPDQTLDPGQIVAIRLAGSDTVPNNPLQAPFKIGNAETLIVAKNGQFVDGVCAKATPYGCSIGRANEQNGFFFFASPTRNAENGDNGKRFIAQNPAFDFKPGVYADKDSLCLRLKDKTQTVHYTLNGSEPTMDSPVLKDSLLLTKSTVIRTLAEGDSLTMRSPITTASYILGADHKMPVISISLNNADMYDNARGIYVKGPGFDKEWPHTGANYWKPWTKKAHVEFFDDKEGKEGFSTDCGLRIFGGFSRAEDKKSFRLKFRGEYGNSEIDYDFFGDGNPMELKDLVIRSGSQDWNRCMVRDEFFTSLMQKECPELLIQEYRPAALYINGEYFGLYFIREKIDKNFAQRKLKLPTNDSVNIIMSKYTEEGSGKAYSDMTKFITSNDMTNAENYDYVKNNVDLQGLIDYKLGEIYSANSDVGNIRYILSTGPGSDRKWHFVFYDLDASWVGDNCTPEFYLSSGGKAAQANVAVHNQWISRLLTNKDFRELFMQRLSHHMHKTFSTKNATAVFDNLVASIQPEMERNCERWPTLKYKTWEKNIEEFRSKFETRPKIMLNALRDYLQITDEENKKYFADLGY